VVSVYFLDSSALVKRYVTETGAAWIQALAAPGAHRLIIARIAWVEVLSALARRQREGNLSPLAISRAVQAFHYDRDIQYHVLELTAPLADAAGQLVLARPLRAYDALQLASALQVQHSLAQVGAPPLTFLSADDRLLAIAQAEGLVTDNPNRHP
jgi:predicted nucleic acid-binding protein